MALRELASRPAHEVLDLRLDRAVPAAYAAALLAALWLLGRRYAGITHDATLYVAQGLKRLDPQAFAQDLFFVNGSQDSFSAFSLLYAPLIALLGPGAAAMALTAAGQIAFVAAAWALASRLAGPARWWSLALLAVMSGYYGGYGMVRIAEPFATARTLAEPLALASLVSILAARSRLAIGLLTAATLLHPLVAASGWAVLLLYHVLERGRLVAALAVAAAGTAVLAVAWPGATLRLDPAWQAALVERSPQLFIGNWHPEDWARVLWGLCAAWLGARFAPPPARRLVAAVVLATLGGIALTGLGVDLGRSALLAALQLWRAHWLMQVVAIVVVPPAIAALWQGGRTSRLAGACLAASCCFGRDDLAGAALLALLAVFLDASQRRRGDWLGARPLRWALVGVLAAATAGLFFEVQRRLPASYAPIEPIQWRDYVRTGASVGVLLPLAAFLWLLARSRFARAAHVGALALLALAVAAWDARTTWSRHIEEAADQGHPFQSIVPRGAQVLWLAPSTPAWIVLRTPSWYGADQGAGIVFSRATALEHQARESASSDLRAAIFNCRLDGASGCRIPAPRALAVCALPGGPAYLVLDAALDGDTAPLALERVSEQKTFYLYACGAAG